MKKIQIILLPFLAGFTCLLAYQLIGSELAPDGTLLESFYLIPMGYSFLGIGILFILVMIGKRFINKK